MVLVRHVLSFCMVTTVTRVTPIHYIIQILHGTRLGQPGEPITVVPLIGVIVIRDGSKRRLSIGHVITGTTLFT